MGKRIFIFREGSTELVLPVTPDSYRVEKGIDVQVVNIHELGDTLHLGYGTLSTIRIHCLLPANRYSFALDSRPQPYIQQFEKWVERRKKLRFIVGDTGVNIPVIIESISHGEQDGTNDVYADVILREYRSLQAEQVETASTSDNKPRESPVKTPTPNVTSYTIKYGDTLASICRAYYGDSGEGTYKRLAEYNNITNPHLIYDGDSLQIPTPLP